MPRRKRPHHRWTPDQLELLRQNYLTQTHQWLADAVGHSRVSVSRQLQIMGLRKARIMPVAPPGMKICPSCGDDPQPVGDFGKRSASKDGYSTYCKRCSSRKAQEWNEQHSEQFRRNKQRHMILKRYGLSPQTYALLIEAQQNQCPICLQPLELRLAIDHDHQTKAVRGVLCSSCNSGLGMMGDSIANLERALAYLRAAENQETLLSVTEAARILGVRREVVGARIRKGVIHAVKITKRRGGPEPWRITLPELQRYKDRQTGAA